MLFNRRKNKSKTHPCEKPTTRPVTWKDGKYARSYVVINAAFCALCTHSGKEEFYKKVKELCGFSKSEIGIWYNSTAAVDPQISQSFIQKNVIDAFKLKLNATLQDESIYPEVREYYNSWARYLSPDKIIKEDEKREIKLMYDEFVEFLEYPYSDYIV